MPLLSPFADGTPYGRSEVTFNVLYPEPMLEEWEVISEEAVLVDNLFSMYGVSDYYIYDITVEKEKTTNKYLQKGKKIDDYVGTWAVPVTDGDGL